MANFVHLRTHSLYSLLEGTLRPAEIITYCHKYNAKAIAITDSNGIFGLPELSQTLAKAAIKPILGMEAKVCFEEKRLAPLVFLAMNKSGYNSLVRLASALYRADQPNAKPNANNDKSTPYLELTHLQQYNEGIIVLSGGLDGPLRFLIEEHRRNEAYALAQKLNQIFPQRFYIELNRNHAQKQIDAVEPELLRICRKLNLPPVASNNCMFENKNMHAAHDILLCIAENAHVDDIRRRKVSDKHHLASPQEMRELFCDLPEACENTLAIATRCNFLLETQTPTLPKFKPKDGQSEITKLRNDAKQGLERRLERREWSLVDPRAQPYQPRLEFELNTIVAMNLQGYFLVVADFIGWAKNNDIPVGPGRGSGAGSLVAWALEITELDPIRWGLLFERFLNPERLSMPDFDIDFCQEQREKVIQYVRNQYGAENVAQIITFGTLQARAVIRDVGRAMGLPYSMVDSLSKTIPPQKSLQEALAEPDSKLKARRHDPDVKKLLDYAFKLEGLYRHASTHAAGVVIAEKPLVQRIPLCRDKDTNELLTQFSMKYVEDAGLVKFDFLGLKTLSVMKRCLELLKQQGVEVDLQNIELDNSKVFDLFSQAETFGVFQFESSGIRDVLRRMRPDRFEDIIATVALYRPGPMNNIPSYTARKHGQEPIEYLHHSLEGVLKETYGIPVYQEQVMRIAQVLAGFSLGKADYLRRAMGKKDPVEMRAQRKSFLEGCIENGIDRRLAVHIFEQIDAFAGYGFNKSHAAAYALIAYQTAWLQVHYPVAYFTAMMDFDSENTDRLAQYAPRLQRLSIALLPPCINRSQERFSNETQKEKIGIRYALGAIKHVGQASMKTVIEERKNGKFTDLFDFAKRTAGQPVPRRALESLIRSGAFDALNANRAQSVEAIDLLLYTMQREGGGKKQDSLFTEAKLEALAPRQLPETPAWSKDRLVREARDAIGFYLGEHPITDYPALCERFQLQKASALEEARGGDRVRLVGLLEGIKKKRLREIGSFLHLLSFSDPSGFFEATMLDKQAKKYEKILKEAAILLVEVDCNAREGREQVQLRIVSLALAAAATRRAKRLPPSLSPQRQSQPQPRATLRIDLQEGAERALETLAEVLKEHAQAGEGEVELFLHEQGKIVRIKLPQKYHLHEQLRAAIQSLPGVEHADIQPQTPILA